MRLNRVALVVSDAARSAVFYETHFGFTERSPQGSLLALRPGDPPADAGEVRCARERLRDAGVPETEWQDDGDVVRVQVSDPDGYRVELYAY